MIPEAVAEAKITSYFARKRLHPRKGVDVDVEVRRGKKLKELIEVKGDQKNDGALRLAFFTGLGQLFVARAHNPRTPVALALTSQYDDLVAKYSDVLSARRVKVYFVRKSGVKPKRLSNKRSDFPETGQGHPDGAFVCGQASYVVKNGSVVRLRLDKQKISEGLSFERICKELGIPTREDSAARKLYRRTTPSGRHRI